MRVMVSLFERGSQPEIVSRCHTSTIATLCSRSECTTAQSQSRTRLDPKNLNKYLIRSIPYTASGTAGTSPLVPKVDVV